MIGILLFWFAFSPVPSVPVKPATAQQEQLQSQRELPVGTTEKIHERLSRLMQQKSYEGGTERALFNIRLQRFYAARGFQPVWAKRTMIAELIAAVEGCR